MVRPPLAFSLTQNIAVHPAAVEMEERHGSIMPQRPERWQALVLSHLSARADGSDDYVVGRGGQNALSRPSPRGKRLDGILTTFREMQEAHTGKAQRMSPSGHLQPSCFIAADGSLSPTASVLAEYRRR